MIMFNYITKKEESQAGASVNNYNKDNPVANTRAVSDSPEQVVKIAGAYLRGIQKEGLMAGGCKHFPGDRVDDRNQHFCTSVNSLSKEEWWKTYGYVYKKILAEKPVSVMVGHISAPALQPTEDFDEVTGYKPATLSRELMTGLLRGELGFDGCIVSDALSMVGVATAVPEERLPVEFINAGGDMALFAEPEYFDYIKNAVTEGIIPMPRLKDAVSRILAMKDAVGLLSKEQPEIGGSTELEQTAMQIAEKSIKIVRDAEKILPLNIKPGENVLICNLMYNDGESDELPSFATVERELNRRGILTTVLQNPKHRDIERVLDEKKPACVLVNSRYSMRDCSGSSLRIGWSSIKTFWRGLVFRHPRVIFTSFADPYKLYELPFLKTYINTFSPTVESQKAFVRVILGEIEAKGKNPVALDGFFDREV